MLLAPVLLISLAVGAIQALAPNNAFYNLARLPELQPVASVPGPASQPVVTPALASVTPMALPQPDGLRPESPRPAATLPAEPQGQTSERSLLHSVALSGLPPQLTIAAHPAPRMHLGRCSTPVQQQKPVLSYTSSPAVFGRKLARAARAQTYDLVVYSERYRQIGFPNGDIPRFYGVCTDVVIRAYRALGVDLQVLVHDARIGTGDTSIDHRRTQTLRRFFARYGVSLPMTDFVEDYQPGDIVTYHRASGRTSQSHIAIVSDVIAPSGRPMIVHNRGWGPQLEDALFASAITGHYRFAASPTVAASDQAATPAPAARPHADTTAAPPSAAAAAPAASGVRMSENASP